MKYLKSFFQRALNRNILAEDSTKVREMKKVINFYQMTSIPYYSMFALYYLYYKFNFLLMINVLSFILLMGTILNFSILKNYYNKKILIFVSLNALFFASCYKTGFADSVEYFYFWLIIATFNVFLSGEERARNTFIILPILQTIYFRFFYTVDDSYLIVMSKFQYSLFQTLCFFSSLTLTMVMVWHIKKVLNDSLIELDYERSIFVKNKSDTALNRIASGVAHEINNPLAILKMSNDSLLDRLSTVEPHEFRSERVLKRLNDHDKMIMRISRIVEALRIYAGDKTSSSTKKLKKLSEVISTAESLHKTKIRESGIVFDIEFANRDLQDYLIDGQNVVYALVQLIINATDAVVLQKAPWVVIWVEDDTSSIYIKVINSGRIEDQDIIDKLFTPFFTTKQHNNSVGIGLSNSRGLMKAIDGDLYFNQDVDNTEFVIKIKKA